MIKFVWLWPGRIMTSEALQLYYTYASCFCFCSMRLLCEGWKTVFHYLRILSIPRPEVLLQVPFLSHCNFFSLDDV